MAYLATLALQGERLQSRVISGDAVNTAELLQLREVIEQLTPVAPHKVEVHICDTLRGVCPRCHYTVDTGLPVHPPEAPPAPEWSKAVTVSPEASHTKLEASPEQPANVVPLKQPPPNFHDGAPLKHGAEPWRSDVTPRQNNPRD